MLTLSWAVLSHPSVVQFWLWMGSGALHVLVFSWLG